MFCVLAKNVKNVDPMMAGSVWMNVPCVHFLRVASTAATANHFSRVRLSVTPWTAAYQAPPSMGFSRQEYWSGGKP